MGSCMAHCFIHCDPYLSRRSSQQQQEFHSLVEEQSEPISADSSRGNFVSRLFQRKKETHFQKKPVLGFVQDLWNTSTDRTYNQRNKSISRRHKPSRTRGLNASDIQLQCLDVRALLARNGNDNGDLTTSPTPVSSLDLEWEHELLPTCPSSWVILPEEVSKSSAVPPCESSHGSSADSLEWDPVVALEPKLDASELDPDTRQLLDEIERLTDQALRETGAVLHNTSSPR